METPPALSAPCGCVAMRRECLRPPRSGTTGRGFYAWCSSSTPNPGQKIIYVRYGLKTCIGPMSVLESMCNVQPP